MTANRFLTVPLFANVKQVDVFYHLILCVCVCFSCTSFFNKLRVYTQFGVDVMPSYFTPVSCFFISYRAIKTVETVTCVMGALQVSRNDVYCEAVNWRLYEILTFL
jgi:uncharacterized membrane protein